MKVLDAQSRLGGLLTLACALMTAGCISTPPLAPHEDGLLGRVTEGPWRVEAWAKDPVPSIRLWEQGQAEPSLENRTLLPPGLGSPQAQWQWQGMELNQGRLVISLRYQPRTGAQAYQDKRFEFDLNRPMRPLAYYRVATRRGDTVDWQTVNFVRRQSHSCRNAPAANPEACPPMPSVLTDEAAPTLALIGNAEEYVPPIKMEVRY